MIVDDERSIREALSIILDWQVLGIEIVGLYRNGAEAFDALLDEYPDIVLTDIKMPGLSGLELLSRARSAEMDAVFVILSGYAEFEFAKQAMRFGVRHYLLKPISEEQLLNVMTEVRNECLLRLPRTISERQHPVSGDLIRIIKTYVRANIADPNLSLGQISQNELFMNADYVSKQFAKKTGERFSAYVTRKRVELACALLTSGNLRVNEVAEQTGFGNNIQYFSRIFKKNTGITPSEYQRIHSAEPSD